MKNFILEMIQKKGGFKILKHMFSYIFYFCCNINYQVSIIDGKYNLTGKSPAFNMLKWSRSRIHSNVLKVAKVKSVRD